MSDLATVDTTYDRFAHDPAYVAANRAFVLRLPLARVRRILDLACGTGAVICLLKTLIGAYSETFKCFEIFNTHWCGINIYSADIPAINIHIVNSFY